MKGTNYRMWARLACLSLLALLSCAQTQDIPAPVAGVGARSRRALDTRHLRTIELPFPPGERSVSQLLIAPDGKVYGIAVASQGGKSHVFRYDPQNGALDCVESLPDPLIQPEELLSGALMAWAWDPSGTCAYSLSDTGAMRLHKADGTAENLGQVGDRLPAANINYRISRAFFFDADGNVYTAGGGGRLYRYSPVEKKLEGLGAYLPAVEGRQAWATLDAATVGPDGLIYGGTFEGYLFTFDPRTQELIDLGKPLRQQRIQGLVFIEGMLYGIGGEDEGVPRAFKFDPETRGFHLGGLLRADQEGSKYPDNGIMKAEQGYLYERFGAMVADGQGNIYLGTTGRLGNLYIWETTVPAEEREPEVPPDV
jgi:hypothetical protein